MGRNGRFRPPTIFQPNQSKRIKIMCSGNLASLVLRSSLCFCTLEERAELIFVVSSETCAYLVGWVKSLSSGLLRIFGDKITVDKRFVFLLTPWSVVGCTIELERRPLTWSSSLLPFLKCVVVSLILSGRSCLPAFVLRSLLQAVVEPAGVSLKSGLATLS